LAVVAFVTAVPSGISLGVFPPCDPPVVPSPDNYLAGAIATKSDILFTVPRFLELWAVQEEDVRLLKTFTSVIFGGGPLGREIGQYLVDQGVKIVSAYGTTEIGAGVAFFPG
jgi:acyl-coenzyme A synthetase/AMP-(fatty) acid ligase